MIIKPFIKLFSNCIIVSGVTRAIICDLQRSKYQLIPISLGLLFDERGVFHKPTIQEKLDEENRMIFESYLKLLELNEFIYTCNEEDLSRFPSLSIKWDFPSQITNMLIDINKGSNFNFATIIDDIVEKLNCGYIQFRHYDESTIEFWTTIMNLVNNSPIKAVDIILKDSPSRFSHEELISWCCKNRKIRCIIVHSSSVEKIVHSPTFGFSAILSIKESMTQSVHCGIIHPSYFSVNIPTYTESLAHNTCLNRKIAIDTEGNIKNCPSMKESYGNIKDTTLAEAIEKPGFKKYWNLTKDQISKCKDCEFRHICTDCRAYLENPEDIYSAPLKCGYDPYTCEWEDWSTNPLKYKAIEYYGMKEF